MIKISDKQERMLAFIEEFVEKNGYPPTYEEIREGLEISTKSLVDYHLNILENADFITRIPNTPRGLRLKSEGLSPSPPQPESNLAVSAVGFDDQQIIELTYDFVTNNSNLYALRINGNSLLNDFVAEGDIVILQRQAQVQNGEVVAVKLLPQNMISLGKYYRENGHVRLAPADTALKAVVVAPEALEVQGKVVAIIRQVDQTPLGD
jgi:repressor LexA